MNEKREFQTLQEVIFEVRDDIIKANERTETKGDKMSELNMTSERVERKLRANGLKRNSRSWTDYEKTKRIMFGGEWLRDPKEYNHIIEWIGDYLDV